VISATLAVLAATFAAAFPPAPTAAAPVATVAVADAAAGTAAVATSAVEVPSAAAASALAPRSNERMDFSISFLGMPMGKVRLFTGQVDGAVAPVFLQAQTSSVLAFVKIREQLATYLDVTTGLPRSATLDAVEGSYRHSDSAMFDRTTNKATVREKGKYDNTYVVDVPPGTLDFLALVFKLRALPLEPGQRNEFPVLAGRTVNRIVTEVVGREKVPTRSGDLQTLKVKVPTGFSGKFSEKNPTYVWFSDDARRVVVRIVSDFAVGHATASLDAYAPGSGPEQASR
jgi:hypothetical protein